MKKLFLITTILLSGIMTVAQSTWFTNYHHNLSVKSPNKMVWFEMDTHDMPSSLVSMEMYINEESNINYGHTILILENKSTQFDLEVGLRGGLSNGMHDLGTNISSIKVEQYSDGSIAGTATFTKNGKYWIAGGWAYHQDKNVHFVIVFFDESMKDTAVKIIESIRIY